MSKKTTLYFTTGELAKTCGVSKHTLFHYDDIGLLKPDFIDSNGYRYYSIQQGYTLDIINVLKKAGSSLYEIKEFIQNQNTPLLIDLLKRKLFDLEKEKNRIERMLRLMNGTILMMQQAKKDFTGEPHIVESEEEYFVVTQLGAGEPNKEFANKLYELRTYCEVNSIDCEFPIWTIMPSEHFESGDFNGVYVGNKLNTPLTGEKILIKPKGQYIIMNHKGPYETIYQTYDKIKRYAESENMDLCSIIYTVDMLSYLAEKNPEYYVIQVSIEVSGKN